MRLPPVVISLVLGAAAMIDEVANRNLLGERRRRAEMIGTKMRVDQIIDLLDLGLLDDIERPRSLRGGPASSSIVSPEGVTISVALPTLALMSMQ